MHREFVADCCSPVRKSAHWQVEPYKTGIGITVCQIQQICTLTASQLHDRITILYIFIDGVSLMIYVLISKDTILGYTEMHETILRMIVPVGPMINPVIGTDLVRRILVTLDNLLQIEELRHLIDFRMKLVNTVLVIHILR